MASVGLTQRKIQAKVIVVADDFGVNPERTDGVIEAFIRRPAPSVTQASLLVNACDTTRAARLANQWKLPLGLHFNLTEGEPLSLEAKESSLVDSETGFFLGKVKAFQLLLNTPASEGSLGHAISSEFKAQCARFKDLTGREVFHWDGHHHVHVIPGVWSAIEACVLLEKRKEEREREQSFASALRTVRIPTDVIMKRELSAGEEEDPSDDENIFVGRPFWMLITNLAQKVFESSQLLRSGQWITSHAFCGLDIMGAESSVERVVQRLTAGSRGMSSRQITPTLEIMTHQGNSPAQRPEKVEAKYAFCYDDFSMSQDRRREMDVYGALVDSQFRLFKARKATKVDFYKFGSYGELSSKSKL